MFAKPPLKAGTVSTTTVIPVTTVEKNKFRCNISMFCSLLFVFVFELGLKPPDIDYFFSTKFFLSHLILIFQCRLCYD